MGSRFKKALALNSKVRNLPSVRPSVRLKTTELLYLQTHFTDATLTTTPHPQTCTAVPAHAATRHTVQCK